MSKDEIRKKRQRDTRASDRVTATTITGWLITRDDFSRLKEPAINTLSPQAHFRVMHLYNGCICNCQDNLEGVVFFRRALFQPIVSCSSQRLNLYLGAHKKVERTTVDKG